jgi:hypothetical protein
VNAFKDRRVKSRKNGKVRVRTVPGPRSLKAAVKLNGKSAGSVTIKRTGTVR